MKVLNILTKDKYFWKTANQNEFDNGLFAKLSIIVLVHDFLPSSFKFKRGILPPLTS